MRYWNKGKKFKMDSWTVVEYPQYRHTFYLPKIWCQQQPGRGRFYAAQYTEKWYFEFSEDALAFKLRWIFPI